MKKTLWGIVIVIIAIAVVYFINSNKTQAPTTDDNDKMMDDSDIMDGDDAMMDDLDDDSMMEDDAMMDGEDEKMEEAATISFDGSAFSPSSVTVKKGQSVTWVNDSTTETWPASAVHPTHTVYPTTGGCLGSTFDACRGLAQGESFTFQFDEVGEWFFHDHLRPSAFGKVIVTE